MLRRFSLVVLLVKGGRLLDSFLMLFSLLSCNAYFLLSLVFSFSLCEILFKLFLFLGWGKLLLVCRRLIRNTTESTFLCRRAFGWSKCVLTFHLLIVNLFSLLSCLFLSLSNFVLVFLFFTLLLFFFINLFCLFFSLGLRLLHSLIWHTGCCWVHLGSALLLSSICYRLLFGCVTCSLYFLWFGIFFLYCGWSFTRVLRLLLCRYSEITCIWWVNDFRNFILRNKFRF